MKKAANDPQFINDLNESMKAFEDSDSEANDGSNIGQIPICDDLINIDKTDDGDNVQSQAGDSRRHIRIPFVCLSRMSGQHTICGQHARSGQIVLITLN